MRAGRVAAGLAMTALAFGAVDAAASTVRVDGERLVYEAAPGESNRLTVKHEQRAGANYPEPTPPSGCQYDPYYRELRCESWSDGAPQARTEVAFVRVEDAGAIISTGSGCAGTVTGSAVCTVAGAGYFDVTLGDRDDKLATAVGGVVDAGAGRDVIDASSAWVDGGSGADEMSACCVYYPRSRPLQVTNDQLPNDGEANEGDNVRASNILGGRGGDDLSGFARTDGAAGDDTVRAPAERGVWFLEGGEGDDLLIGGAGSDWLSDRAGNDVLRTSGDGRTDYYNCGSGVDSAVVDPFDNFFEYGADSVNYPSGRNCEQMP